MEKMRAIARREEIEEKINTLKRELSKIQNECHHGIIIMFECSNYYWTDSKCLFCGKKMDNGYVLEKKESNVVNADLECLLSNEHKYNIVKDKYERISGNHPDWKEKQIVAEINEELRDAQEALDEIKK